MGRHHDRGDGAAGRLCHRPAGGEERLRPGRSRCRRGSVSSARSDDQGQRVSRPMATAASPVTSLCEIEGRAAPLLTAERTALNFLQRLSGIATMTRKFVDAADGRHHRARHAEDDTDAARARKYAVTAAVVDESPRRARRRRPHQGQSHPAGRRDRAGARTMRAAGHEMVIEIEAQSVDDVDRALASGAPRILADNFSDDELRDIVQRTKGRAQIEVSGGITLASDGSARRNWRRFRLGGRADAFGAGRGPEPRARAASLRRRRHVACDVARSGFPTVGSGSAAPRDQVPCRVN